LLCREAFKIIKLNREAKKYLAPINETKFIHLLKEDGITSGNIFAIECKLVVVVKKPKSQSILLFDSRHFPSVSTKQHLTCLVLDSEGRLLKQTKSVVSLPRLGTQNYKYCNPRRPLWKLLNLNEQEPDPKNRKEALALLAKHGLMDQVNIYCPLRSVRFCFRAEMWNTTGLGQVDIQAYTTKDYTIGFRKFKMPKEDPPRPPTPPPPQTPMEEEQEPDMFSKNRSSAVSVKLAGLNEALQLGLINLEEFRDMSHQMGKWSAGALFIELDSETRRNPRYLTYMDQQATRKFLVTQWNKLFDCIYERRDIAMAEKKKILGPLLDRLAKFPTAVQSPWKKCLASLERCMQNFKVVVHDEEAMHAVKVPFIHYLRELKKKYFRGITVRASAINELVALATTKLTFFSLAGFVTLPPTLEPLPMKKNQLREMAQRGCKMALLLFETWRQFGKDWMENFTVDIHCDARYVNLSSLSFTAVWLDYTRFAGHFHQGLEKTKAAYEDVLRKHSRGGYSFSCQDKVDAGQLLSPGGEIAKSIRELDFVSSYPAACSNMQVPTGFAVGYTNIDGTLTKSDPVARHKSFEFKAVFYTLTKMLQTNIVSVFSNFHQSGFLSIGMPMLRNPDW
jgi:hypothetical protein